eukprot:scaffold1395_cov152-Amphora_coffeaeformis.AAC.25
MRSSNNFQLLSSAFAMIPIIATAVTANPLCGEVIAHSWMVLEALVLAYRREVYRTRTARDLHGTFRCVRHKVVYRYWNC